MSKKYVAALLGGSGSVGTHVLKSLLADVNCKSVVLVSRRPLDDLQALDPDRVRVEVCDPLDDVETADLKGANVAFCTLGHGSSRKATKEDLMRVDATIPASFAAACAKAKVSHYCLMTACDANENAQWSSITRTAAGGGWYNHVKGVAERKILEVGLPYVFIAQPAALLGSPHTPGFMSYIPNAIVPAKYSSAHVSDIANGMVRATINAFQKGSTGVVRVTGGVALSEAE